MWLVLVEEESSSGRQEVRWPIFCWCLDWFGFPRGGRGSWVGELVMGAMAVDELVVVVVLYLGR